VTSRTLSRAGRWDPAMWACCDGWEVPVEANAIVPRSDEVHRELHAPELESDRLSDESPQMGEAVQQQIGEAPRVFGTLSSNSSDATSLKRKRMSTHRRSISSMNATGALPTPKEPERETWQLLMQLGLDLRTRRKSSIISAECGIDDAYDFQDLLGKGGFGKVFQAVSKKDGQPCAIKCVDMKNTDPEVFQRELEQARKLQNPHLVRLIAAYQDERTFFLVMELYQGGDLLTEVTQHGLRREGSGLAVGIPEQCLVEYAWQMFSAVAYLHYHFIAHRDIKCENFMKASLAANAPLKLIDLGVSACFKGGLTEVVGTITTIAPEVFSRRYNETLVGAKASCWMERV
ncbi:unnamed protein product, partial [Effrenium voratum]